MKRLQIPQKTCARSRRRGKKICTRNCRSELSKITFRKTLRKHANQTTAI